MVIKSNQDHPLPIIEIMGFQEISNINLEAHKFICGFDDRKNGMINSFHGFKSNQDHPLPIIEIVSFQKISRVDLEAHKFICGFDDRNNGIYNRFNGF